MFPKYTGSQIIIALLIVAIVMFVAIDTYAPNGLAILASIVGG